MSRQNTLRVEDVKDREKLQLNTDSESYKPIAEFVLMACKS